MIKVYIGKTFHVRNDTSIYMAIEIKTKYQIYSLNFIYCRRKPECPGKTYLSDLALVRSVRVIANRTTITKHKHTFVSKTTFYVPTTK